MLENLQSTKIRNVLLWNRFMSGADRRIDSVFHTKPFANHFRHKLHSTEYTRNRLITLMTQNKPFAVVRFGLYENELCKQYLEKLNHLRRGYSEFIRLHIDIDAGMFSNSETEMDYYAEKILSLLPDADLMAYWNQSPNPNIFDPFCQASKINADDLYPFPFLHKQILPYWQKSLQGKKVLIVTAFPNSVLRQYSNREHIWENPHILPDFELKVIRAVQTSGMNRYSEFATWEQAYNYMFDSILQQDFDIALISCGSYGTPLALELKKNGRKAIQWGGCYQLWFGLKGQRWCQDQEIKKYFNSYWKFPRADETPQGYKKVNNGCYWKP